MKQLKACLACHRPVAKSLAYQAEIGYIAKDFLSGRKTQATIRGYICPECNQKGGYKTSSKKLKKFKGEEDGKRT